MPRHIITLDVERIDRQAYDEAMDQLFLLHHVYPTYIKKYNSYPEDPNDPGLYAGDISAYAGY